MNMVGGGSEVKPQYSVYGFRIAVDESDPSKRVTYPKNIFGQLNGASLIETPAYGTGENCLNDWADCPLITGIKRQVGNAVKGWLDTGKRTAVAGSVDDMVMTYVPTWYMRAEADDTKIDVAFSKTQLDSNWKDYAGSVGTERIGHFRLGCYACKSDFKSYSGEPEDYKDIKSFISGCQALGTGFDIMTWYQWNYLAALATLLYKSTDLQNTLAGGAVAGSYGVNEKALSYANDFGMSGTIGYETQNQMAFFWIQNLWGNCGYFVGGAKTDSLYRLMTSLGYSSAEDADFELKELSPALPTSMRYGVTNVVGSNEAGFFPTRVGGSITTYFSDYCDIEKECVCVAGGGPGDFDGYAGPFCISFDYSTTSRSSYITSRLSYRL